MSKINLMFHDVKKNPSRWNTKPERFGELIKLIAEHQNSEKVVLTIDDAGKGNFEYILPILEEFGIKAHFFVPTMFISDGIRVSSYMTSIQIKEISDLGHYIGSHSHSHPKNISLICEEQIKQEWLISKEILESITGKTILTCSIPGGFYSLHQAQIIKDLGYQSIYNSVPRFNVNELNGLQINGRFSIERDITNRELNLILNMNNFNELKLKIRQNISQSITTLKHKIELL